MKKIFKIIMIAAVLVSGVPFFGAKKAAAIDYTPEVFKTGYYNNLISDDDFINKDAMTIGDIQQFLVTNNSYLQYFTENGKSAAQIIYEAAHAMTPQSSTSAHFAGDWGIPLINTSTGTVNPMVILVTLQKEQSLITRPTRNDYALTWAMGYGCLESGSRNPNLAGFTNQVGWGAWQLRYNWYRAQGYGAPNYQVNQTATFSDWTGKYNVTFANRATASLYRYTPHVFNGNYNFWRLFHNNSQFLTKAINPLVKNIDPLNDEAAVSPINLQKDAEGAVWAITGSGDDQQKWLFDSANLADWGLTAPSVVTDSISGTNGLADGAKISNLVKLKDTEAIYLIENGKRRFLLTADSFNIYGYDVAKMVSVPAEILKAVAPGEPISQLVKREAQATFYYVGASKTAYPFASEAVFNAAGLDRGDVGTISEASFAKFAAGTTITETVKDTNGTVYLIVNGYKRPFASMDDFSRGGYSVSNIAVIPGNEFINLLPTGSTVVFPAIVPAPAPVVSAPAPKPVVVAAQTVKYKTVTKCSYQTKVVKGKKKKVRVCSKVKVPMKKVTLYKYQYKKTCVIKKVKGRKKNVCTTKRVKVPYTVWR